jgi:hypothetical protein
VDVECRAISTVLLDVNETTRLVIESFWTEPIRLNNVSLPWLRRRRSGRL